MSAMPRFAAALLIALWWALAAAGSAPTPQSPAARRLPPGCNAPAYFGVCDPYVPGTLITIPDRQPFLVISTWPGGPAEKVGICAGDKIVAANGVSAYNHTASEMLKQIVSKSPTPVSLTVQRGKQMLKLTVSRVRESELARLSKQKYFHFMGLYRALVAVPLNENRDEVTELEKFDQQLAADYGFKIVPVLGAVPKETPEEAIKTLQQLRSDQGEKRIAEDVRLGAMRYWVGAGVAVLRKPEDVLVSSVDPNSPAYRAGLLPGDRIIEFEGHTLAGLSVHQILDLLSKTAAPPRITLRIRRGDSESALSLQTEDRGAELRSDPRVDLPIHVGRARANAYFLGAGVLYDGVARAAAISRLDYPSPAFDAGLLPGDQLLLLNGIPVSKLTRDRINALLSPQSATTVWFKVSRVGKVLLFRVVPETRAEALAKIGRKLTKFGPAPLGCPG